MVICEVNVLHFKIAKKQKIKKGSYIMSITKFNKTELLFNDNERFDTFKTLKELFDENGTDEKYIVKGVYTYKSSYGEGCFIKSDGFNISLPSHLVETLNNIRQDKESVEEINQGKVAVNIYSYKLPDKYPDKVFYSINFIEL